MTIDTRQQLLATINSQITLNGTGAITGPILNNVLDTMVNSSLFVTGAWSPYTSYSTLDMVSYNGTSYIAITPNVNQTPTNTTYWSSFSTVPSGSTGTVQYNGGGYFAGSSSVTINTAGVLFAPNAYNTSTQTATATATLTAAQITGPFLLSTPSAPATYTLPAATLVDAALGTPGIGTGWEFVIFTNAAFVVTVAAGSGWTLVGTMTTGGTATSFARFRVLRNADAPTYVLYRIST